MTAVAVTVGYPVLASALGPQDVATAATPSGRAAAVWQPAEDTDWMWELDKPLKTSKPNLMGTGVTAWNGDTPPGDNPVLYDIDGIENPASTIAALHSAADHVVCYIEVGSAGNYYTAKKRASPSPTTTSSSGPVTSATGLRTIRSTSSTSMLPPHCRSSRP